jgi:hypothetical protein
MARTEGRPVPRKAGGTGKKGKKFVEDKVCFCRWMYLARSNFSLSYGNSSQSALLSLIDGMPKWTAGRPQANKEDLAADDHMASTNDDGRGVISFETVDKKKKNNKKGNKNSNGGGKRKVGAGASGNTDGSEGRLIVSAKGKEKAVEQEGQQSAAVAGEESSAPKKKVVDRLSDKNRELVRAPPSQRDFIAIGLC